MLHTKGKYIVGRVRGVKSAVVFNEMVEHVAMARVFDTGSCSSAGMFCLSGDTLRGMDVHVYEEATELFLEANIQEDPDELKKSLGLFNTEEHPV